MTTRITEKNISSVANAGVQWQSVIVADGSTTTTGVAGRGYFINTTNAAHTFTLPATATFADTILIKDYAGTFASNKLTIARNGHKIQGAENNSLIGTNRASIILVYVDVTRGWEYVTESNVDYLGVPGTFISATGGTVTTSGDFKIHSFTGDGSFVVATVGNSPTNPLGGPDTVSYAVIGGGGAGGGGRSGGGGAGGFRTCSLFSVSGTTYPITVGGGGAGNPNSQGGAGTSSTFSTITSAGGGGGGTDGGNTAGTPGGSGGGGVINSGGTGNTPPVSPPQGNPGGTGSGSGTYGAGGGGGAGAVGSCGSAPTGGGPGGAGSPVTSLFGAAPQPFYQADQPGRGPSSTGIFAGGGGGGVYLSGTAGQGGPGGGGNSGTFPSPAGTAATVNTGGGGGGTGSGGNNGAGGTGGKGIVIIKYKFQ